MGLRWQVTTGAVGALLLVGAPTAWHHAQPADTVGDVPTATATPPTDIDPTPTEDVEPSDRSELTNRPDRVENDDTSSTDAQSDTSETAITTRPTLPTRVTIDAAAVDAPVVSVGLEADGSMEIPADVATVGWYEPGVRPGEQGTAVLSGHVDSRTQGRGAFFDLGRTDVGDTVSIAHEGGSDTRWRVVARTSYPKDELPIDGIFTRFSEPRLVLITCGGDFDDATRHYTENVVVYAEPVTGA